MVFTCSGVFLAHFIYQMHKEALKLAAKNNLIKVFYILSCCQLDLDKFQFELTTTE